MNGFHTALVALFAPVLTFFGVLVNTKLARRNSLTDQLQEELARHGERIENLERRERIRDDYIGRLRKHISDGLPPPPPEWPEELR